jgi:hypothetical protein
MSDHYQVVCFVELDERTARDAAHRLVDHLRAREVAGAREPYPNEPDPSDSPELIHADIDTALERRFAKRGSRPHKPVKFFPGTKSDLVTLEGDTNGSIELEFGWRLHADERDLVATCPSCGAPRAPLSPWRGPLARAVRELTRGGSAALSCPSCSEARALREWRFEPPAFVAALALSFANWSSLRPEFVEELERVAGSRIGIARETV